MLKKPFLAIALVAGLLCTSPPAEAASKLVIDAPEFDFGYVPQNAKISHKFSLHSAGEDSLKILKVVPGCGCTKTPLEKTELGPGERTDLEVIFSTGHYTNRITKRPKIQTNGVPQFDAVIIHSNVVRRPDSTQPVVIKPYKLDISQFGDKPRDEMAFTITNVSGNDLNVRLIDLPGDLFEITLVEKIVAGGTVQGLLKLHPDALETPFEKSFTIECDDETATRFTIPVKRAVKMPGASKPMTADIRKKSK